MAENLHYAMHRELSQKFFRSILKKSIDDLHHHRIAMMVIDHSMLLCLCVKNPAAEGDPADPVKLLLHIKLLLKNNITIVF